MEEQGCGAVDACAIEPEACRAPARSTCRRWEAPAPFHRHGRTPKQSTRLDLCARDRRVSLEGSRVEAATRAKAKLRPAYASRQEDVAIRESKGVGTGQVVAVVCQIERVHRPARRHPIKCNHRWRVMGQTIEVVGRTLGRDERNHKNDCGNNAKHSNPVQFPSYPAKSRCRL